MAQQKLPKPLIVGVLASLATGLLTLLVLKTGADKRNRLARRIPQLDLNNPGSQDDFPKPPMPSEVG
jgi:hypothetical protein